MSCPECGGPLDDYTELEGGWCPNCEEWWPADIVREEDESSFEEDDEP